MHTQMKVHAGCVASLAWLAEGERFFLSSPTGELSGKSKAPIQTDKVFVPFLFIWVGQADTCILFCLDWTERTRGASVLCLHRCKSGANMGRECVQTNSERSIFGFESVHWAGDFICFDPNGHVRTKCVGALELPLVFMTTFKKKYS